MEQINQLKIMRDEALARLQLNPDYKLLISLDRLIRDIEHLLQTNSTPVHTSNVNDSVFPLSAKTTAAISESTDEDEKSALATTAEIDEAFEKITNDLKEETDSSLNGSSNLNKAETDGAVKSRSFN